MKNKAITVVFISFLILGLLVHVIVPDEVMNEVENRALQKFPEVSMKNIISGKFSSDFEKYMCDQIPYRNVFRGIRAQVTRNIFQKIEDDGIYSDGTYLYKDWYPTNDKAIAHFVEYINGMEENFTKENHVYFACIPDKNYYAMHADWLNLDYTYIFQQCQSIAYTQIDLRDCLQLRDYYKSDIHWKQSNLQKVVEKCGASMHFSAQWEYTENTLGSFAGTLAQQAAVHGYEDTLIYLTNPTITHADVYYMENDAESKVYPKEKTAYDVFLGGANAYIEIENPNNTSDRELVIFRDSFASAIAPLFLSAYSKITLIDTRYISKKYWKEKIKFTNQDVLFMYSTGMINNSYAMK